MSLYVAMQQHLTTWGNMQSSFSSPCIKLDDSITHGHMGKMWRLNASWSTPNFA